MSRRRTPRWTESQPLFAPASECVMFKRGYASREEAKRAIDYLRDHIRSDDDERVEAREYRCQHCGFYHLTSDSQNAKAS